MNRPEGPTGRILLIDDDEEQLNELAAEVNAAIDQVGADVVTWRPSPGENVEQQFESLVAGATTLVVTDYDLTRGSAGFFGVSVVAWCQQRAIPVGDYSRGNRKNLPAEPNLFEFRFASGTDEAAREIAAIYGGFTAIRNLLDADPALLTAPSPASMLADMLGHPPAVSQFSLYMPQISANASLVERLRTRRTLDERKALATYVLGHILFNAVLRYPGPLLDRRALCSYLAVRDDEAKVVLPLFEVATYEGPFSDLGPHVWRDRVDDVIEEWASASSVPYADHPSSYRRALAEERLGGAALARYSCPRCGGERGGFRCPFTEATVCELSECSVGSSGWLPQGADLSRVERTFYDETAPMLGN